MKQIAVVGVKGQVTIPKLLRKRLGISQGTELRFEEVAGALIVKRVATDDPLATLVGLGKPQTTEQLLTQLRGPKWSTDLDDEE
ncbi:MAG: AbrB/MazE/SpoVT family DNA-binding domain-containing protein [Deltaproteobacteria bacterium]|nr:AbrB/MazE/SpoVT family DNA-binding domain-containing protein [Deltaproteobacteria bacterium]